MFESHFTHHFFRQWGAKEGAAGIKPDALLLGNSQNEFDEKIGDLAGVVGCRFFLIEFKLSREGIAEEVKEKVKPHRYHLYQHLRRDQQCRQLAFVGHYAAYPDEANHLAFEPYAHAVAPRMAKSAILAIAIFNDEPSHELDFSRPSMPFDGFYSGVTSANENLSEVVPGFFSDGFGLPQAAFETYINCMYQHLEGGVSSTGEAIVGMVNPKTKKFTAFRGTIEDLIEKLYAAFEALAKSIENDVKPPRPSRP